MALLDTVGHISDDFVQLMFENFVKHVCQCLTFTFCALVVLNIS